MSKAVTASPRKPIVFVVDDDEAVRKGIDALLESVGYARKLFPGPVEFLDQFDVEQPGCLVLDIRMPQMSGMDLQERLNDRGTTLPIIFITGHGDVPLAVQALKNGAFDFVQKPFRDQELLDRINHALEQDAESRRLLAQRSELRERAATLSAREQEVMRMIVEGKANKVIAQDLSLSERTVEIHRARLMEKMGARSAVHLVKMTLVLEGKG